MFTRGYCEDTTHGPVCVDRFDESRPHEGKILGIVQAHADDMPLFSGGLVAKLIAEGYRVFLIQTTNDEKCGPGTIPEAILSNERDVEQLAEVLGVEDVFNFGYRNHRQDENSMLEQRCRLIFLFRHLRVDTVMSFNPWGHWEENPDHYVTAQAVEAACWMAGMGKDYPEQVKAGIAPHGVQDKYYWVMRPGQPYNLVTDIGPHLDAKIASMSTNKSQGPAGAHGRGLRDHLARQGLKLLELDGDDEAADRAYIQLFGLEENKRMGEPYGLEYAEYHYYFPPGGSFVDTGVRERVDAYVKENSVPLK
ncbi:MAG: PIG-L deacetylase family protein [Candidatus Latescibacterota bacterium]|nr:PIG-L deacetylase family protein [Candidatus Latescibacterota bacterium]